MNNRITASLVLIIYILSGISSEASLSYDKDNPITSRRTVLERRITEFNHHLIAKDYEEAKECIEPRGREKWFKMVSERDDLASVSPSIVEKIDLYESNDVAVVTTTTKLPAAVGGGDLTGGENWIFLKNQWYKSNLDILPLRAIARPVSEKINSGKKKEIRKLEQLIYESQDEAGKYLEESQYYTALFKKAQKKVEEAMNSRDISTVDSYLKKCDFYLKESKKKLQLVSETLTKQAEYAKKLLELKR